MSIRGRAWHGCWLTATVGIGSATAQVSVSIQTPYFGFSPIPNETLRVFGLSAGGTTNQLTWTATGNGGATVTSIVPSTSPNLPGNYVDITLGNIGATCVPSPYVANQPGADYSISSAANVVLTATSVDNTSVAASTTINVCNPPHTIYIPGTYETLFAGQPDELEAKVWGLIDKRVTWTVQQPPNGDATLSDLIHNSIAFSATVPGRYILKATAVADRSISATQIRYVSGLPFPGMTPSHAIPIDCSIDPELTGSTYDIGAGHTYATIGAALAAANVSSTQPNSGNQNYLPQGTTLRVFNTDTTGRSPSIYREYMVFAGQGPYDQPISFMGCADQYGNQPILSMNHAVSVPNNPSATAYIATGTGNVSYYQIAFWNPGNSYANYPDFHGAQNWRVEGFAFRDGWSDDGDPLASGGTDHAPATTPSFFPPTLTTEYPVGPGVACLRFYAGDQVSVRGNDIKDCTFGILGDFNANGDWGGFFGDVNVEGNALSNLGDWSIGTHSMYVQGFRQRIWNNWFGANKPINNGILLKIRGVNNTVAYNSFQNGTQARVIDFVDDTDSGNFMDVSYYLDTYIGSYMLYSPNHAAPPYTPDIVSAAQEAWLHDYVIGNSFKMDTGPQPPQSISLIHYFLDQAGPDDESSYPYRRGFLNFAYNTVVTGNNVLTKLFDTDESGSNRIRTQWPTINNFNNALYVNPFNVAVGQEFVWSSLRSDFLVFGGDWINARWGTNNQNCIATDGICFGSGWSTGIWNAQPYLDSPNLPAHLTNFADGLKVGPNIEPFNELNLTPTQSGGLIGAAVSPSTFPSEMQNLPIRYKKNATTYALQPRTDLTTVGAFDYNPDPPEIISIALPTTGASVLLGYTERPPVTCLYDDGTSQTCSYASSAYTWSVSNSSILSVSSNGVITGLGAGSATVTTTINGMSSSQTITVRPLVPMFTGNFKIVGVRVN